MTATVSGTSRATARYFRTVPRRLAVARQSTRRRIGRILCGFSMSSNKSLDFPYDRQKAAVNSTNTGIISMRPIHISSIIATFVDIGKTS